ncbi:hypothetical protein L1049_021442 [Liquidambar formosana]|uniref:Uncharacterized protein n=1 Tax=Liquidambar formosana TaxID=63359 RepID=A0AAP0N6B2_LIQFO
MHLLGTRFSFQSRQIAPHLLCLLQQSSVHKTPPGPIAENAIPKHRTDFPPLLLFHGGNPWNLVSRVFLCFSLFRLGFNLFFCSSIFFLRGFQSVGEVLAQT